jgi:hypothetical protein
MFEVDLSDFHIKVNDRNASRCAVIVQTGSPPMTSSHTFRPVHSARAKNSELHVKRQLQLALKPA